MEVDKQKMYSPAKKFGELMAREFKQNSHFYFFSPDETTSNKFDQIFTVEKRAWNLPRESWDLPESPDGRIVEMLAENVLFSVMTGHLMNGEPAMLGSYEAFLPIVTGQILQQIKFIKQSEQVAWREPMPAVNLLSTSTCWRQDHNGFTHQSPALISTLLDLPSDLGNCFFPLDDMAAEAVYKFMMQAKNVVNLTTFNKIDEPRYLALEEAEQQVAEGAGVLHSEDAPDVVLVACGDLMAQEVLAARKILAEDLPETRIRCVYICALSYGAIGTTAQKMLKERFDELFTLDQPIIADFHGYPEALKSILVNYADRDRLQVHGFSDEGSTTTPFEMLRRNHASRYDLAIDVVKICGRDDLVQKYQQILAENHAHAVQFGEDMIQ